MDPSAPERSNAPTEPPPVASQTHAVDALVASHIPDPTASPWPPLPTQALASIDDDAQTSDDGAATKREAEFRVSDVHATPSATLPSLVRQVVDDPTFQYMLQAEVRAAVDRAIKGQSRGLTAQMRAQVQT